MAKFRSWNEKLSRFFYWQNGDYFSDDECKLSITCNKSFTHSIPLFNWQNAEQGFVINGQEIFENDYIKFENVITRDSVWAEPAIVVNTGYSLEARIKPYYQETPFNQCIIYPKKFNSCDIVKLGNIHEGEN